MEHDGHIRDEAALLRAAADDPAAFARFYRRHVHGVIAFFHRRTGDAETAADLTAETFAAALEGCHRYAPDRGAPAAWLYGIAHRQLAALDECSYEEIAAAQQISPLAARQRVSRGLAALRAHLRGAP